MQWAFKSIISQLQGMDHNSFFMDAINCEAVKSWANIHHFSSNNITPKTT